MGLFSKDSPAEKKLKELTGGFMLSTPFMDRLKREGLKISDGNEIKDQLKREIKQGRVNESNLESRLDHLIYLRTEKNIIRYSPKSSDIHSNLKKKCPQCGKTQDGLNEFCINCGYKFYNESKSQKECPKCSEMQDEDNVFCINCGFEFNPAKQIKNNLTSINDLEITCPYCELKQSKINKVCENCGYDFEKGEIPDDNEESDVKTCPICEFDQPAESQFCEYCGYDFVNQRNPSDYTNCPSCNAEVEKVKGICPSCGYDLKLKIHPEFLNQINNIKFLSNYNFNLKTCPECNTQMLKTDLFCFNCGESVLTTDTVKNDNLVVKDGKLTVKEESNNNDELADLEALYSQTVKSKYAPSFKIAYVLYLKEFEKNPTKKFSDKLARHYETTPNKLKKQALEDEFIELASPISEAQKSKVTDLKEILKEHNLKVSGKKDELIKRLSDNLTDEELKKYFKSKNYQISDKGLEFLQDNNYILYIEENKDIKSAFYSSEIIKIFGDGKYSQEDIYDKLINYLSKRFDEILNQERWVDFKTYANALAEVLEDKGELKKALILRFKVFLFDVNNFSIVTQQPNAKSTRLKQKDLVKLTQLMHTLSLSIDEVKQLFNQAYDETLFKTEITKEDSLIYLLKVFGGEDLAKLSVEINEKYSNPH